MMEQGELEESPDVVMLDDEESVASEEEQRDSPKSPHNRHEDEEEEIGPGIKPPQAKSKKDKHKHKHRREKKRSSEREREKYSSHSRRQDQQGRGGNVRQRDDRGRVSDKDRHDERRPRDLREKLGRENEDAERRKRSMQERERLEKLEKQRHRLEKERKRQHERLEHQEKMERAEREWDRQKRAHRAQRKEDEEKRKPAVTRHEVDKRRDRDKVRRRSRSPQPRDRDENDRRRRPRDHRDREGERSREEGRRVVREEKEEEVEEEEEEEAVNDVQEEEQVEEQHASPDSTSDEESASQSGSEESESSSSGEEEEDGKKEKHKQKEKHPGKVKSKFESESEEEESDRESVHRGTEDDTEYIEQTPPESPVELAPDLPPYFPAIQGCRNVEEFSCLNRIEEGTYGVVYRARDKKTDEIVALKRLKMEKEKEGFPITSLREINTLLKAQHPNIVTVREIVVGSNMDRIYIVMDYVEHDLKSLMEIMKEDFLLGEVKTLMVQLLRGVGHLHDNWIIHRDLKTSNLLFSHKGILKIGDFGLAREYGSPLKHYTPIVVTLWYRAPELLLACKKYSTAIDMWSVGCIMAELLTRKALFPGKSEIDQLNRIFKDLGTPNEKIWPGVSELKGWKTVTFAEYPYNQLRNRLGTNITDKGFDIVNRFLTYDPTRRISAEEALKHEWFTESPHPVDPSMFPTWPAKSEQTRRVTTSGNSPKPPSGGKAYAKLLGDDDEGGFHLGGQARGNSGPGFALKF